MKNIDGNLTPVFNGKTETLDFVGNDEEPLAFHTSYVDGAVLFTTEILNHNKISLNFRTRTEVKNNSGFESIFYTLETLTESAYRYNMAKSKQIGAEKYGISDPVINYKNTTNGYGFLGASSMIQDSIKLN